jgi:hypothetical protein
VGRGGGHNDLGITGDLHVAKRYFLGVKDVIMMFGILLNTPILPKEIFGGFSRVQKMKNK